MPMFDHTGKEIPDEDVRSKHVYAPGESTLTRDQLKSCIIAGGYAVQVVDPSDFLLLSDGDLETQECILISDKSRGLESLPRQRNRTTILNHPEVVLVDLVVESPFDATQVLGPLEDLATTFGEEVLRQLQNARTVYAINVPRQACPLADQVLDDVAKIIAARVSGAILDLG